MGKRHFFLSRQSFALPSLDGTAAEAAGATLNQSGEREKLHFAFKRGKWRRNKLIIRNFASANRRLWAQRQVCDGHKEITIDFQLTTAFIQFDARTSAGQSGKSLPRRASSVENVSHRKLAGTWCTRAECATRTSAGSWFTRNRWHRNERRQTNVNIIHGLHSLSSQYWASCELIESKQFKRLQCTRFTVCLNSK